MRGLRCAPVRQLALLGAHCDDIAIGAGGALLQISAANPAMVVHALVLTGGGTAREAEELAALTAFCPDAKLELTVLDLPDGRVPARWEKAKQAVEEFRCRVDPDVVFAPHKDDAHQDHRTLAELTYTAFRDHLVFGYEIVKWDGDLAQPSCYLPLADGVAERKAGLLHEHYPSQQGRDWFDRETFLGIARLRGVQCRVQHAEAYFVDKVVLEFDEEAACGFC
ncbi:MAG: PIG-L family deacetylase [Kutzneria sp.]|nr:PIG-L family deacetylase [Kutzneria sp.]